MLLLHWYASRPSPLARLATPPARAPEPTGDREELPGDELDAHIGSALADRSAHVGVYPYRYPNGFTPNAVADWVLVNCPSLAAVLPLHNDRFWSAVWMLLFMAGIDVDPGATVAVSGVGGGVVLVVGRVAFVSCVAPRGAGTN